MYISAFIARVTRAILSTLNVESPLRFFVYVSMIACKIKTGSPDDRWEWCDARLGWRDELGLSLAFSKRFASSLPPEDVLDSTSLTPLSAGLAGSDPLPAFSRQHHETKGEDTSAVINDRGQAFTANDKARQRQLISDDPISLERTWQMK